VESFIIDNVGSLVTGGPKEVLWNLLKKGIDYKTWIGIFVEAGDTVETYENRGNGKLSEFLISGEDEQGEFRKIVFNEDNMKKLAERMYEVNGFDFQSELERYLNSYINNSGLSNDNKVACKKHFIDIVINDIKEKYPDIMLYIYTQETNERVSKIYNMIEQMGNLPAQNIFRLYNNSINTYPKEKILKINEADYQRHNNRKTNTGALNKKIKWKLSNFIHGNFGILDGTKEHVLNTVKKWENERKSYPKWLIIPYDVCRNLYYKTPRHIGKILDILNDEECMYVVYEFVWRYETGMFSYIIYTQEQVYSVWKKYYLLLDNNDKKCDVKKYINEWFYVGRALLREFKEDGNEEDWNYVWNILNKRAKEVKNGDIILYMDKAKYYLYVYNIYEVRLLLQRFQRMTIPEECYDIYLNYAGIEIACGNLENAKMLLDNLIRKLDVIRNVNGDALNEQLKVYYSENQVYIDSVYAAALHLYSFVLQGIAFGRGQYEMYQEEINTILDKADMMSYCFDFNGIIDFVSNALLDWHVQRYEKKETFEINRNTVNIIESNNVCEEAYYLYRVLDLSSFPIACNHVNFFGNIEIPWILVLYNCCPQIALNIMVRCSKPEIGKYIITRRMLVYKDTESIEKEIRYLYKILEYCLDEFEEILVEQDASVCDYVKNNISEILIRYMSRCPEDIQIEVLSVLKKVMERQNVVMDNRMDYFIHMIIGLVSEKNKGIMFESFLQTDIVEHKVMLGHYPSVDLFTWYFRKDESKKYCKRTDKISEIIKFLLSDEDDDNYIWKTKVIRLNVLAEMDLLTQKEKELLTQKVWSRVNTETNLPDISTWYAWVFLNFESDNKLPAISIKDYLLKKRLMLTLANEKGVNISMREDTYLDEMLKLIENIHDDFWEIEEAELIFKDALDYWEILKPKIDKYQKSDNTINNYIINEYTARIYKMINMLTNLYNNITKNLSDELYKKVKTFITELEQYNFGITTLQLLFESKDNLYTVVENIIENTYDIDERVVINALEASYSYIKKYPDNKQAEELLENMILILKTRKEPGLVSAINLIHNLLYIKNVIISKQVIQKLDKCLLLLDKATQYKDEEEKMIKHKVLIRKSCMGLAYQILEKYSEYAGDGVRRWQEIYNGDEFAEVKNEMI